MAGIPGPVTLNLPPAVQAEFVYLYARLRSLLGSISGGSGADSSLADIQNHLALLDGEVNALGNRVTTLEADAVQSPYDPGVASLVINPGHFRLFGHELRLSGTEHLTIQGDGCVVIVG